MDKKFAYTAKVSSGLFRRDNVSGEMSANNEGEANIRIHNFYFPKKVTITDIKEKEQAQ